MVLVVQGMHGVVVETLHIGARRDAVFGAPDVRAQIPAAAHNRRILVVMREVHRNGDDMGFLAPVLNRSIEEAGSGIVGGGQGEVVLREIA